MEEKKSPKANLENKKLMFIQIGLIISLAVAWAVFEIKSYDKIEFADVGRTVEVVEEEMVEITKQEQKPQPVEVPKQTTQIQVVEDDVEVEDIEINADVDQNEVIEEYVAPEIEDEDIQEAEIFTIVEEMPDFPGGTQKLADIKGIGKSTAEKLLLELKSVKTIKEASLESLTSLIGPAKAKLVYDHFHTFTEA